MMIIAGLGLMILLSYIIFVAPAEKIRNRIDKADHKLLLSGCLKLMEFKNSVTNENDLRTNESFVWVSLKSPQIQNSVPNAIEDLHPKWIAFGTNDLMPLPSHRGRKRTHRPLSPADLRGFFVI